MFYNLILIVVGLTHIHVLALKVGKAHQRKECFRGILDKTRYFSQTKGNGKIYLHLSEMLHLSYPGQHTSIFFCNETLKSIDDN